MTSPDGITWTLRSTPADLEWRAVCWAPELNLLVAVAGTGSGQQVMTSPDGRSWTLRPAPPTASGAASAGCQSWAGWWPWPRTAAAAG